MKKIIYTAFAVAVIVFLMSVCAFADNGAIYSNGTDMYNDGMSEYYINMDDEDKLYKLNLYDMTEEKVLDEHIISMVSKDKCLYLVVYANEKSKLLKFDTNSDTYLSEYEFDAIVTSIAIRDNILYYVENGSIFTYNLDTNETSIFIEDGITDFLVFVDHETFKYYTKHDKVSEYMENTYSFESNEHIQTGDGISLMSVSSYSPRLQAPAENNAYYTSLNVFHTSGYGMVGNNGNCTCYAYGRSYENLGSKPKLCTKNAENWYQYNKTNGYYSYGSKPELGAVVVWSRGVIGDSSDGAGHVAVVEVINGDAVTTSESGWESYYFKTVTRSASDSNFSQSSKYTLQGFIYVCGRNSSPEEPETCNHSYYRGIEAVHPHREYMMCSCGDYYYTGSNGYYTTYEGAHSHREYYVCEVETCEYNRTYTGNYGTTKKKESTYPYKEYYVCLVSCSYDGTYTGENAIPGKPVLKKSGSSYYVDDNITLSWNTTKNTTHYNIYFDVLENGQYVRTKTKHYVESGMTVTFEQGEYRALVQATNSNYWTEDGSTWLYTDSEWVYFTVYSKPCAPTGVNVSTAGSKVTVSWNSSTNATSYDVYLVQSPWTWADIKYSQNVSGTSYTFINVANGDYKAFVIARPNKDDVQSNWVSLTVNSKKPDAPVIKHSLSNNYGRSGESVTVSWDAISNADSYTYYLTEYPEGYAYTTNTAYGTIAENKIKFTNMSPGKYSVFVHANNSVGRSPQSNWISFYIYEKEYKPVATEMYNGHIYAIYDYEMSWSFAKELCEDMGGHLATITSKEENDFVVNLINYGSKDAYWLGATDFENSTESYCWITGEDFEYANWDEGEPSNTGTSGTKEHFAEIRKSYSYKWNDVNNINKTDKGFILEIEPNAQSITYVDTFNNSRYLVIDRNTAWTEAQKYCEFLGGYLVAINSEEEKNYINSIILEGTREWYYLGGIKKGETWKWVDGSELEHFDWADNAASWSGEYLMKYKNKEGCIALTNTYYPAKHIHNIGFICEIELPYSSSIVEKRNNTYTVTTTCHRVKQGKNIIVIGYDDSGKFVDTKVTQYTSDLVTTELTGDIDKIKIMIWNDLSTLKPLCEAEIIPESEFVIK